MENNKIIMEKENKKYIGRKTILAGAFALFVLIFAISFVSAEGYCSLQNETNIDPEGQCCLGLSKVWVNDYAFICDRCGDGICSQYEDVYGCFQDCGGNITNLACPLGQKD